MTQRPQPLTEALRPRIQLAARLLAERVDPGPWSGYRENERLDAVLTKPAELGGALTAAYTRAGNPDAAITLGFLEMKSISTRETVAETVIEDNIEERRTWDVSLPAGASDTRKVSHTFARTRSFSEAAEEAWKVAAKASLTASYAGIGGSLEASAEYGRKLSRQDTGSETESDTVEDTFSFTGPVETVIEAYRSRKRVSKIVRAVCDVDGKLYFRAAGMWEFTTFATQFLPVARRTSDDSVYGYREFMDRPVSDSELDLLEAPPDAVIEFPVEYDSVSVQSLKQVKG